jgi:hypothetical protein
MSMDTPGKSQRPPEQATGGPHSDEVPTLSKPEQRVLQAFVNRIYKGRGTTMQNVCGDLGLKSPGSVAPHRERLASLGILKVIPHKAGVELAAAWNDRERLTRLGIELQQPITTQDNDTLKETNSAVGSEQLSMSIIDVPVLGLSAAGSPLLVQPAGWKDTSSKLFNFPMELLVMPIT